jgi:hypothetical protein
MTRLRRRACLRAEASLRSLRAAPSATNSGIGSRRRLSSVCVLASSLRYACLSPAALAASPL